MRFETCQRFLCKVYAERNWDIPFVKMAYIGKKMSKICGINTENKKNALVFNFGNRTKKEKAFGT